MSRAALYYPFHLCREDTLTTLLARFESVHFRDYMALQLTAMSGTTAYSDRMGQQHPDLVASGRIVQGYSVSGPLDSAMTQSIDRDLVDAAWRHLFHTALAEDRRFQRGLFDLSHRFVIAGRLLPGPAALLGLIDGRRLSTSYSVETVRQLADRRLELEEAYSFEYGLALVKTAAALRYTVRLAEQHRLTAVTDSPFHFALLQRTVDRETFTLENELIKAPVTPGASTGQG